MRRLMIMAMVILVLPVMFGCANVASELKNFNSQVVGAVSLSADVILTPWPTYSQGIKDLKGNALNDVDQAKLKMSVDKLDSLYLIRASLTDEQKVDTVFWYGKLIEAGGPEVIAVIIKLVGQISAYFK